MTVSINKTPLPIKEYKGQRMITFRDIDAAHDRPNGTAKRNFNKNKNHFIQGKDYFVRNSYEAREEFGIAAPNGLTLITESGYLMLAKSFTDDLAWKVQRELVNNYFRAKDTAPVQQRVGSDYEYIPGKEYRGTPAITTRDFQYFTGVHSTTACIFIKKYGIDRRDFYLLKGVELAEYKKDCSPSLWAYRKHLMLITQSGIDKLEKRYWCVGKVPRIDSEWVEPPKAIESAETPAPEPINPELEVLRLQVEDNKTAERLRTRKNEDRKERMYQLQRLINTKAVTGRARAEAIAKVYELAAGVTLSDEAMSDLINDNSAKT